MVLLEHPGYGLRDRPLLLYFWDERDGPDFSGWWITADYIGNNDFVLTASAKVQSPAEVAVGEWRSPIVETGLRRKLTIGFESKDGDKLVAVGADAATPLVPDGMCKIMLSKLVWVQDGIHHGKPSYRAEALPDEPSQPRESDERVAAGSGIHPAVYMALGVLGGAALAAVVLRAKR